MLKSKKRNYKDKNGNYILLKITTPNGENLLEKESFKKIIEELRTYIIQQGGNMFTTESLVVLEDRKPLLVEISPERRVFSIPKRLLKSNTIKRQCNYDIAIFNEKWVRAEEFSMDAF